MGLLAGQLGAADTVAATVAPPGATTRQYGHNDELWEYILGDRLWPTATITLAHFWLSDWLPLCPGAVSHGPGQPEPAPGQAVPS
jgi:hypothetical protein